MGERDGDMGQETRMKLEPYNFQNIYIITTYRCNWKCAFCLFRFNREKEAPIAEIIYRLEHSIQHSPRKVYIKITGGEPLLRPELLHAIFKTAEKHQGKVYKIGIGTNGSIQLPHFFKDVKTKTHIFLSRHDIEDALPRPHDLFQNISPAVDFRINCNLIRGGVDSLEKIEQYVAIKRKTYEITHFCFRELSKVDVDANSIYPPQIYDYVDYYKEYLVPFAEIEAQLSKSAAFQKTRINGNYYDTNHWYWYSALDGARISIKFRSIDEARLIEYNVGVSPYEVDEFVIHPDGTLTGCWDKELKVILRGGE